MGRIEFDAEKCCGCAACVNVCPRGAITMIEDEKGITVPHIDDKLCVDCGLCEKVCDFKKTKRTENNTRHAYSLVINNRETLKKSTSGGAFTALSDTILQDEGIIVGAVMESDFTVHHIITSDIQCRNRMRGSKYVQSSMGAVYNEMKEHLKEGKKVLFSGTPCQCAAVSSFFGGKYDNLILVDFLCHGVPTNRMFKEHIQYLNNYYGKKSIGFTFREKTYGWDAYNNNNKLQDNSVKTRWINQIYYNFFTENLSLRDGCYDCPYRSLHRPSDITIADFWGIERYTHKKDYNGVSLVMTHSKKGQNLLDLASDSCKLTEYPFEQIAWRVEPHPLKHPKNYEMFWQTYRKEGYKGLVEKFFDNSLKKQIRFEIRKIVKLLRLC